MMDLINGLFELLGGFFILPSIRRVRADRRVAGVSWVHMAFFTGWGFWNLLYYPALGQWCSFFGGVALVVVNLYYLGLLLYYGRHPGGRC
jgi:hypothetical protein